MSRKLLAALLSGALVSTTGLTSAAGAPAPARSAPASASETAKNEPPLPPGRAREIKKAQGLGDDDLGPGVIIGSIALATGLLVWLMFHDDEDDSSSGTGTN